MRHRKKGRKLNRNIKQRKALFRGLIESLIIRGHIQTTEAKAKAIKGLADRLVAKAKTGTLSVRRQIMAFLPNKKAANKLVDVLVPLFKDRPGGFTRIIRLGRRRGDNTQMVKIEFVKKPPEEKPAKKPAAQKKTKTQKAKKK